VFQDGREREETFPWNAGKGAQRKIINYECDPPKTLVEGALGDIRIFYSNSKGF